MAKQPPKSLEGPVELAVTERPYTQYALTVKSPYGRPAVRSMQLRQMNLFECTDAWQADILIAETNIPESMQLNFLHFLSNCKPGCRLLTYNNLEVVYEEVCQSIERLQRYEHKASNGSQLTKPPFPWKRLAINDLQSAARRNRRQWQRVCGPISKLMCFVRSSLLQGSLSGFLGPHSLPSLHLHAHSSDLDLLAGQRVLDLASLAGVVTGNDDQRKWIGRLCVTVTSSRTTAKGHPASSWRIRRPSFPPNSIAAPVSSYRRASSKLYFFAIFHSRCSALSRSLFIRLFKLSNFIQNFCSTASVVGPGSSLDLPSRRSRA